MLTGLVEDVRKGDPRCGRAKLASGWRASELFVGLRFRDCAVSVHCFGLATRVGVGGNAIRVATSNRQPIEGHALYRALRILGMGAEPEICGCSLRTQGALVGDQVSVGVTAPCSDQPPSLGIALR